MAVGLIGCGRWGRNLARTLAGLGALAAVADVDAAAAEALGSAVGVRALTPGQALSSDTISAVAIAAPAPLHAELALAALAAGKDVLVEKPFATSMRDAARVAAAARGFGRVVMVGHLMQYHPAFEALLALVRAGRIGAIRYATASRAGFGRMRTEENALFSLAPHDLSMLLAVFGEAPQGVGARGASFLTPGVADAVWTDLAFSGGRTAQVFSAWLAPEKDQTLRVVGEHGMLTFDDVKPWPEKLALRPYAVADHGAGPFLEGGAPETISVEAEEPLQRECAHFIACCRDRVPPRTGVDEALAVQAVLNQADAALREETPRAPVLAARGAPDLALAG